MQGLPDAECRVSPKKLFALHFIGTFGPINNRARNCALTLPNPRGGIGVSQMSLDRHFESEGDLRRYEVLLDMADALVSERDLSELLRAMAERLRPVVDADAAHFYLYDPAHN